MIDRFSVFHHVGVCGIMNLTCGIFRLSSMKYEVRQMKVAPTLKEQISDILERLPQNEQQQVLAFAKRLADGPKGIPVAEFIDVFRQANITPEEVENMRRLSQELGL